MHVHGHKKNLEHIQSTMPKLIIMLLLAQRFIKKFIELKFVSTLYKTYFFEKRKS